MDISGVLRNMEYLKKSGEFLLPLGVVGVLAVMILPMPPFIMDMLLTFNITFAVIILLVAIHIKKPLEFATFPTILLVATLLRLSLNVATTRLILLHGGEGVDAAGQVIKSFGNFVVGGNYTVGFVVFCILVIINFVVITKGAGRIAEVSARFTLDAMPGKQMSIDADLNAGLIGEEEARRRREEIAKEADFYGAMDGASKFVRGDAVAGILITLINIGGGLAIGVLQQGLSISDAAMTYTLLTVGDGLVAQIPALIISTAAGIVVSTVSADTGLNVKLGKQFMEYPQPIMMAGAILFVFGLVPGLPQVPFFVLSAGAFAVGYAILRALKKQREEELEKKAMEKKAKKKTTDIIEEIALPDTLALEIGYRLIPLVDEGEGAELLERIRGIRRQFAEDMGLMVPPVHIKDNLQLKPSEYVFFIKGLEVGRGELMVGYMLALNPGNATEGLEGIPTKDPAFGLPALWIPEKEKERAQLMGYTVVSPSAVIATHTSELIKANCEELLGRQEVQNLLDKVAKTHPKIIEELVPNILNVGAIQKVLHNLLKEGISIRDIHTILETLADYGSITKDPDTLTEYVRMRLRRRISRICQMADGRIPVITLAHQIEEAIAQSIKQTQHGSYLTLEPAKANSIIDAAAEAAEDVLKTGIQPAILVSPEIRRFVRGLMERKLPSVAVLSYNEIADNVRIETLKVVSI